MRSFYTLLILVFLCLSCTKDQLGEIDIPQNVKLDIDRDGKTDFTIVYQRAIEGDPIGNYDAVKMYIESQGTNQVLKNEDFYSIFLEDRQVIQIEVDLPYYWEVTNPAENNTTPLARIRTDYDSVTWQEEWRVLSLEEKETYLIGCKLNEGNNTKLAFFEFSVDPLTGVFLLCKAELL